MPTLNGGGGGAGGGAGGGGGGAGSYPITAQLVAAVVEGACKPPPGAGNGPSISSIGATAAADAAAAADANASGVADAAASAAAAAAAAAAAGAVRCAYHRLCAAVLVHFPRRLVQLSDADADAALSNYRCYVEVAPAAAADDNDDDDDTAAAAAAAAEAAMLPPPPSVHLAEIEVNDDGGDVSDSDSDWEPLEGNPMVGLYTFANPVDP
jgi:hypothetical protein